MCLVEIEKSPKLMPACAIKVAPDMKIFTKTNLIKKTRESILEFLLINHPLDCPICDQGGECDLQDQAMIYGSDRGRFYEYKRSMEDKNGGPLIKTIMTRCIHCTRCIRFATEIAGVEVYGTSGRGKGMQVGTYITTLFNSELSGNVTDLCPVGALTSKPYAFTVRPWELKSIETIDVFDAIGSNIRIDVKGSELMRILPRANNAINQQWITDKARFAYDGLKCQRLHYPMAKYNSKFIPISWKEALTTIKDHIGENIRHNYLFDRGSIKQESTKEVLVLDNASPCTKEVLTQRKKGRMFGVIGQFVDQESVSLFKHFFNQLGQSNLYLQEHQNLLTTNINLDFRTNYLLNFPFQNTLEKGPSEQKEQNDSLSNSLRTYNGTCSMDLDFIILVGTNPRLEAPLFNVRLRQLFLQVRKNVKTTIATIGSPVKLTYTSNHLGNGPLSLSKISNASHEWTRKILYARNPMCIQGISSLQRLDGSSITAILEKLLNHITQIKYTIFLSIFYSHKDLKYLRTSDQVLFRNTGTGTNDLKKKSHCSQKKADLSTWLLDQELLGRKSGSKALYNNNELKESYLSTLPKTNKQIQRSFHSIAKKPFFYTMDIQYQDFLGALKSDVHGSSGDKEAKDTLSETNEEDFTFLQKRAKIIDFIQFLQISSRNISNILHSYANTVGSLDLGCQPSISNKIQNQKELELEKALNLCSNSFSISDSPKPTRDCIYLLGADYPTLRDHLLKSSPQSTSLSKPSAFVIYQGHHGDFGAINADVILPSTSYVEKKGKYVNTEGRVQQTQIAIQPDSGTKIRDDWKIINALSKTCSLPSFTTFSCSNNFLSSSSKSSSFQRNEWLFISPCSESLTPSNELRPSLKEAQAQNVVSRILLKGPAILNQVLRKKNGSNDTKNITPKASFFLSVCLNKWLVSLYSVRNSMEWENMMQQEPTQKELIKSSESINFKQLFNSIAPNLNENNTILLEKPSIYPHLLSTSFNKDLINKNSFSYFIYSTHNLIPNTNFIPLFDNFYLSNVISKSSITMGKCSSQLGTDI